MKSMLFWRRAVALVFTMTFSSSVCALCIEAAAPQEHMACCKDGEMTCATHGDTGDCCSQDGVARRDAVTTIKVEPVSPPSLIAVWSAVPFSAAPPSSAVFRPQGSPPVREPGPPPYIAFSSLLI